MPIPSFRYHPDPLKSGSVVVSDTGCHCCGRNTGHIYVGPVYAETPELEEAICPDCIASGLAHEKFDATFVDSEAFDDDAPAAVVEEITTRTPGFSAWQAEHWPSCCGEPAVFLEPAGIARVREIDYRLEGSLMMHIVHDLEISGGAARRMLESLKRDQSPTAYVFRCRHCHSHLARIDFL